MKLPKHTFPVTPLVLVLFVLSFLLNIFLLVTPFGVSHGVQVEGVIDGDTLVVEGKTRVRLRQLDAPELEFCGGQEAKKELEQLVMGKKVRIEEMIPDRQGRGMGLVYVGATLVNAQMLTSGWARFHHDTTSQSEQLKSIAGQAKTAGIGIFARCQGAENPDNPTCNIKGNIDKNTYDATARKYYLPGCVQYPFTIVEQDLGEGWFCTEKEAQKAGFTKAETCKK